MFSHHSSQTQLWSGVGIFDVGVPRELRRAPTAGRREEHGELTERHGVRPFLLVARAWSPARLLEGLFEFRRGQQERRLPGT